MEVLDVTQIVGGYGGFGRHPRFTYSKKILVFVPCVQLTPAFQDAASATSNQAQ